MIADVKKQLVGLELRTLSLLLQKWSVPEKVEDRKDEWKYKVPVFRKAVIAAKGSGRRRVIPQEIIHDEYGTVSEAMRLITPRIGEGTSEPLPEWIKDESLEFSIETTVGERFRFVRPFPSPWKYTRRDRKGRRALRFVCWERKPELVVREIVAARLGCSESNVRDVSKLSKSALRYTTSRSQRHLAAVFIDLCSYEDDTRWAGLRAETLDALYGSRYHLLGIYYLLQLGNALTEQIVMGDHDEGQIKKLCNVVNPNPKSAPFSDITG